MSHSRLEAGMQLCCSVSRSRLTLCDPMNSNMQARLLCPSLSPEVCSSLCPFSLTTAFLWSSGQLVPRPAPALGLVLSMAWWTCSWASMSAEAAFISVQSPALKGGASWWGKGVSIWLEIVESFHYCDKQQLKLPFTHIPVLRMCPCLFHLISHEWKHSIV